MTEADTDAAREKHAHTQVPEYEEDMSQWSDVPEEGLSDRVNAVRALAYRVERLSGELMEALKTGQPLEYDPDQTDGNHDKPKRAVMHTQPTVVGPISEVLQLQLPWGL